jgi:hypothetical protein
MPRVVGVDVSLGRGLDVALVEGSSVKETWSRLGPDGLGALLRDLAPDAVAIDAPPRPGLDLLRDAAEAARLPVPPRPGTHLSRRVAEYELSRRGIGSHQTPRDTGRIFSWMTAGFDTFAAAEAAGYPVFLGDAAPGGRALEVFPYASYVALAGCLSPGRRWRVAWRRSVLVEAGVEGIPEDASIDVLDAICAALTGERWARGAGSWVGDGREGVIVLPVPDLAAQYRRCPAPEGVGSTAGPVRLCECGCGAAVRRRFLQGHDGRLRGRLVREARAGDAARGELARLGWLRFIEKERG